MELIAALGGGSFVLASLVVGGRLVALSWRTRGLPEFLLGTGLFFMGGVGYPLMTVTTRVEGLPDTLRTGMLISHMCTTTLGMGALAWFTRRVFRPGAVWAGLLLGTIVIGFVALAAIQLLGPGPMAFFENPKAGPWAAKIYLGLVPMSWAGFESIRYYTMQRRRLALGLADPVVTDRFRLWGVAILSADAIVAFGLAFKWMGFQITSTAIGALLIGGLGLVTAGGLWLAFVPPRFYLDRVVARAEAAMPSAKG